VHVKFGTKVIEVATFRCQIDPAQAADTEPEAPAADRQTHGHANEHAIHRDNTFGTDEEDAFRRDFTINALFYDISTFSIIDFVGGLQDLRAGVVRCIGDPDVRFREDPVRMLRAVAFAARLGFTLDAPVSDAIGRLGGLLATAAPARLMDEYYKILRTGVAGRIFASLRDAGLLKALSPMLHAGAKTHEFRAHLARLDAYRQGFEAPPDDLTNAILLGSLIVPLGFTMGAWPGWMQNDEKPGLNLGILPLARRDVERMHQVLMLQRRLRDPSRSGHARRQLTQRSAFADALTWLEIHGDPVLGDAPDAVLFWRGEVAAGAGDGAGPDSQPESDGRRRRRRRRPGRHRRPESGGGGPAPEGT
jgi:poly(A) polymerase